MKKCFYIFIFFSGISVVTFAQNNYVYNGGSGQGFTHTTAVSQSNNSIFVGSSNQGFDKDIYDKITLKLFGGIDDGFSKSTNSNQYLNSIYNGSLDDGMAFLTFAQVSNNNFYNGGLEDGFSSAPLFDTFENMVYEGGEGDGFSASGFSKLIWDGDLSKDWLMADNWNIPIVPTMNHSVCIPNGVPHYPKLSAVLGISLFEEHTYASSDVMIMAGAQINGVENVKIIVNGKLVVAGNLFLNYSESPRIVGRKGGLIQILTGGSIIID